MLVNKKLVDLILTWWYLGVDFYTFLNDFSIKHLSDSFIPFNVRRPEVYGKWKHWISTLKFNKDYLIKMNPHTRNDQSIHAYKQNFNLPFLTLQTLIISISLYQKKATTLSYLNLCFMCLFVTLHYTLILIWWFQNYREWYMKWSE